MNPDGTGKRQLTHSWSPDGQKIVFEKYWGMEFLVMDADGKNKR